MVEEIGVDVVGPANTLERRCNWSKGSPRRRAPRCRPRRNEGISLARLLRERQVRFLLLTGYDKADLPKTFGRRRSSANQSVPTNSRPCSAKSGCTRGESPAHRADDLLARLGTLTGWNPAMLRLPVGLTRPRFVWLRELNDDAYRSVHRSASDRSLARCTTSRAQVGLHAPDSRRHRAPSEAHAGARPRDHQTALPFPRLEAAWRDQSERVHRS